MLQDQGQIAYFEKRGSSLLLYWTSVHEGFERDVAIAFVGSVPGQYTGSACYVYEYYNKKNIKWIPGFTLEVERAYSVWNSVVNSTVHRSFTANNYGNCLR